MKPTVVVLQRRLPEYRIAFFDRLRARLAGDGVRLVVVHGEPTAAELARQDEGVLPWAVRVHDRYLRLGKVYPFYQSVPAPLLERASLIVLPHENGALRNYPLIARKLLGRPSRLALWGHGPRAGWRFRDHLKRWTTRRADWWFAYTSLSVDRVATAGFPAERITNVENAIDTEALQSWAASITEAEREGLRRELGIDGPNVAVTLGSLSSEKLLPFLVQAADLVRERVPDFHLVLVGDGPLRRVVEEAARARPWMHAVGAKHGREKALCCSLARVNLNPGMVGLGIVDSFAMGVPLVTTRVDLHSPEIAYLEPERNGLITEPDPVAFASVVARVLADAELRARLQAGCALAARRYTIANMAENFARGVLGALGMEGKRSSSPASASARGALPAALSIGVPRAAVEAEAAPDLGLRVAVIWQRFLPYHEARLVHLASACRDRGITLLPVEVASDDATYGFPQGEPRLERRCCFPGSVYHQHAAHEVHGAVLRALAELEPDVVFAPATPFPEGMAAVAYRNASGARVFMMDDAWEKTDRRGAAVRAVKRLIHRSIDGAFVPGPSHQPYYRTLGFDPERIVVGVDAVDNELFAASADAARRGANAIRAQLALPDRFFLYVGRFLPRKGVPMLLRAYGEYRRASRQPIDLVLVGGTEGDLPADVRRAEGVRAVGRRFGEELRSLYGLAEALILPSDSDPWGLVVNEALAAGMPVIVSRGCGARYLVVEGSTGWTFEPRDVRALAAHLSSAGALTPAERAAAGERARARVAEFGLGRFAEGVFDALRIPRRLPATGAAAWIAGAWKGRVRVY